MSLNRIMSTKTAAVPNTVADSIWAYHFLTGFLDALGIDLDSDAFAAALARFKRKPADLALDPPFSTFVLKTKAAGSRTVSRTAVTVARLDRLADKAFAEASMRRLAASLAFAPELTDLLIRGRCTEALESELDKLGIRLFTFSAADIRFRPEVDDETAAYVALTLAEDYASRKAPMSQISQRFGPEALALASPEDRFLIPDLPALIRQATEGLGLNALAAEAVKEPGAASETGVGQEDGEAQVDKSKQTEKAEKSDKAEKSEKSEKGSKASDAVQWPWLYRTIIERPPSSLKPAGAAIAAAADDVGVDTIASPFGALFDQLKTVRKDRRVIDQGESAEGRAFLMRYVDRVTHWCNQQKKISATPQGTDNTWTEWMSGQKITSADAVIRVRIDEKDFLQSYAAIGGNVDEVAQTIDSLVNANRADDRTYARARGASRALMFFARFMAMPAAALRSASDDLRIWRSAMVTAGDLMTLGAVMPLPVESDVGVLPRMVWTPIKGCDRAGVILNAFVRSALPHADRLFSCDPTAAKLTTPERVVLLLSLAATAVAYGASERGLFQRARDGLLTLLTPRPVWDGEAEDLAELFTDYAQSAIAHFLMKGRPALSLAELSDESLILRAGWLSPEAFEATRGKAPEDVIAACVRPGDAPVTEGLAVETLLKLVRREARLFPGLTSDQDGFLAEQALFAELIDIAVPALERLGFVVSIPEALAHSLEPEIDLTVDEGTDMTERGLLSGDAFSAFRFQVSMGGVALTDDDIDRLLGQSNGIFRVGGRRVYLASKDQNRLREARSAGGVPSFRLTAWEKLRAVLSGRLRGYRVKPSSALREHIEKILCAETLPIPEGLKAELRPYQKRGFEWMARNLRLGLGSLIADDMGLGKTLQVISVIQHLKNSGDLQEAPVLVVAPASILINWQREIERFAPGLKTLLHHGVKRRQLFSTDVDVVLTSYALLRIDRKALAMVEWRLLVLDEAQAVKNSMTGQSHAVRLLNARQVIAMTGTPVENRLLEYWSIMRAVEPGLLGEQGEFCRDFADPINEGGIAGEEALKRFRALTSPFILRRMKTDRSIIADLPDKNIAIRYTQMNAEQRALYRECLGFGLADLRTLGVTAQSDDPELARRAGRERRMHILALITRMKQIANSPSQFLKTRTAKPDSGKGEALMELLGESLDAGNKVLVFTQYREMADRLVDWVDEAGFGPCLFYHGELNITERMQTVDRFQNDPSCRVMVLTLRAGGTGLNLTAANVVIHYDLWWNPAVENQATDRAYRIGQTKDVMVYRLVTAGTFEERINALLESKQHLADMTVVSGEKWLGDLTDSELEDLFSLRD